MRKLFLFAAMLFVLPCLGQNSLSEALLGNETFKSGGYYERVTCINFALGSVNTVTWKDVHLILKEIDSASDRRRVLTLLIESKKIDESNDSDHLYLIVELETHAYDAKSSLEIIDKFVKNLRSHQLEIIVQATKDGEVSGKYAKRLSEKLEFEQLLYLLKLFESQRNARLFAQSVLSEESFGQLRWEHIRIICENFKDRSYRSEILAYLKEKRVKIDSSSNDVCSSLLSINQMVEIEVSSLFNFIPEEQKLSFHREEMTQIISALKSEGGMYREKFLRCCEKFNIDPQEAAEESKTWPKKSEVPERSIRSLDFLSESDRAKLLDAHRRDLAAAVYKKANAIVNGKRLWVEDDEVITVENSRASGRFVTIGRYSGKIFAFYTYSGDEYHLKKGESRKISNALVTNEDHEEVVVNGFAQRLVAPYPLTLGNGSVLIRDKEGVIHVYPREHSTHNCLYPSERLSMGSAGIWDVRVGNIR